MSWTCSRRILLTTWKRIVLRILNTQRFWWIWLRLWLILNNRVVQLLLLETVSNLSFQLFNSKVILFTGRWLMKEQTMQINAWKSTDIWICCQIQCNFIFFFVLFCLLLWFFLSIKINFLTKFFSFLNLVIFWTHSLILFLNNATKTSINIWNSNAILILLFGMIWLHLRSWLKSWRRRSISGV